MLRRPTGRGVSIATTGATGRLPATTAVPFAARSKRSAARLPEVGTAIAAATPSWPPTAETLARFAVTKEAPQTLLNAYESADDAAAVNDAPGCN